MFAFLNIKTNQEEYPYMLAENLLQEVPDLTNEATIFNKTIPN